jgi:hypothetical protein
MAPPSADVTGNPKGEGVYAMQSPDGRTTAIPYSKVGDQGKLGYRFTSQDELARYAKDRSADPVNEDMVDRFMDTLPQWIGPAPAWHAMQGFGAGATKLLAGADRMARAVAGRTPGTGQQGRPANTYTAPEEALQEAAATPTKGLAESAGEAAENVGEFWSGEGLMSLLGKSAEGLSIAEKLKQATGVAQVLEKFPVLDKLARIGVTAVKQGALGGAQTLVKTGGDVDAAKNAGALTALTGGAVEGAAGAAKGVLGKLAPGEVPTQTIEGVEVPVSSNAEAAATPTAQKSGEAYAASARGAIKPHLERVNQAIEDAGGASKPEEAGNAALEPGGEIVPGSAGATAGATAATGKAPVIDTDALLNTVHDFTGAADRLAAVNDAGYSALDKLTGGRFRELNREVADAQKAAWRGGADEADVYQNKLSEMNDLIDKTKGINPETVAAFKASWRRSYQLRDFGHIWDRNFNGVPGATQVSQAQRGINGNGLMRDLQKTVSKYGRANVEDVLGPGRLENLENIARLNQTNAQRQAFNLGVRQIAKFLPGAGNHFMAGSIGGAIGHMSGVGGWEGAAAGELSYVGMKAVLNAIKTNPKIGQYVTYAIESGARPEYYGPTVARMIQQSATQPNNEKQNEGDQP